MQLTRVQSLAGLVRHWIMLMTTAAQSGHATSSLSATDLMVGLVFGGSFRFDVKKPTYHNNDRLIFSKGHASPLFYSLWAATGAVTEKELMTFRRFGSRMEGHPVVNFPFTEVATGSLGQGLSVGVGMALNAKLDKLSYRTYVLLGDSEMAEGSVWEAIQLAAHYKLSNLVGIIDVNRLGQRGQTMYGHNIKAYADRVKSFGWRVITIDGHSMPAIIAAYKKASQSTKPTMIVAKTVKGKGVSLVENKNGWHGKALYKHQYDMVEGECVAQDTKLRGTVPLPRKSTLPKPRRSKSIPFPAGTTPMAARTAFGHALTRIGSTNPAVVVLDAEVSNSTRADIFAKAFPTRFFEMYIAEQNMVGVALGLARRGKIPFVSTFAAFLTRAYDQIRMSQYSDANITFVGSHAGVSIGKDGSSQMALEDIAMFRSLRQSVVLYPSDAIATNKLVELSSKHQGIVYIRTTREDTPILYTRSEQFSIGGSKTLKRSSKDVVTVVTAGITLHQALRAYEALRAQNIAIRVIDLYSIKPLDVTTLKKAARDTRAIIVVEDHYESGGIGEAVKSALYGSTTPIHSLAVRKMPRSGKPQRLLDYENISERAILRTVKKILTQ